MIYNNHAINNKHFKIDIDYLNYCLKAGVLMILFLIFLFVVEKNSLLSAERAAKQKNSLMAKTEESVSNLEISAVQLESSQSIESSALSEQMVPSEKMKFVSLDDESVALAR